MARASTTVSLITIAFLLLLSIILFRMAQDPQSFTEIFSKSALLGRTITINSARVSVGVADTEAKREQGLSGKPLLPDGTGLLMVFDQDGSPGIWMKDMNFAIDVIWIDKDWRVVQVDQSFAPDTFPAVIYPSAPVRYILEVPAGFADIHNIKAGQVVEH